MILFSNMSEKSIGTRKKALLKHTTGERAGDSPSVAVGDLIALLRAANGGDAVVVRLTNEGEKPTTPWKRRKPAPPPAAGNAEPPPEAAATVAAADAMDQSQETPSSPTPAARSSIFWGQHAQLCPSTRLVSATARLNRPPNRPSATPCPRTLGARQIKTSKTIQMVAVAEATLPSIRRCHEAVARGISKAN